MSAEILRCPICLTSLDFEADSSQHRSMICPICRYRFEVQDALPAAADESTEELVLEDLPAPRRWEYEHGIGWLIVTLILIAGVIFAALLVYGSSVGESLAVTGSAMTAVIFLILVRGVGQRGGGSWGGWGGGGDGGGGGCGGGCGGCGGGCGGG